LNFSYMSVHCTRWRFISHSSYVHFNLFCSLRNKPLYDEYVLIIYSVQREVPTYKNVLVTFNSNTAREGRPKGRSGTMLEQLPWMLYTWVQFWHYWVFLQESSAPTEVVSAGRLQLQRERVTKLWLLWVRKLWLLIGTKLMKDVQYGGVEIL
jgi:hypothetical protein